MQAAGDILGVATPDLVLGLALTSSRIEGDFGAGRLRADLRAGQMSLTPPEIAVRAVQERPGRGRVLGVNYAKLRAFADPEGGLLPADGHFGQLHAGFFGDGRLLQVMNGLFADGIEESNPGFGLVLDGALLQIAGALVRLRSGAAATAALSRPCSGLARWQERRAVDFLRAHLAEDVALETLAAEAKLSPSHFARMFKATTGLPPAAYQRRLRLEEAQRLMLTTDLPVTEIALRVGYDTPQAFARMFRAETGTTPSDWRRKRRA